MLDGREVRLCMIVLCIRVAAKQNAFDKSMRGQEPESQFYKNVVWYRLITAQNVVFIDVIISINCLALVLIVNRTCNVTNTKWKLNIICHSL